MAGRNPLPEEERLKPVSFCLLSTEKQDMKRAANDRTAALRKALSDPDVEISASELYREGAQVVIDSRDLWPEIATIAKNTGVDIRAVYRAALDEYVRRAGALSRPGKKKKATKKKVVRKKKATKKKTTRAKARA